EPSDSINKLKKKIKDENKNTLESIDAGKLTLIRVYKTGDLKSGIEDDDENEEPISRMLIDLQQTIANKVNVERSRIQSSKIPGWEWTDGNISAKVMLASGTCEDYALDHSSTKFTVDVVPQTVPKFATIPPEELFTKALSFFADQELKDPVDYFYNDEDQRRIGRFKKDDVSIPFSDGRADPRLADWKTKSGRLLCQTVKSQKIISLVGVSGAGKTRSIFDIADETWLIYYECVHEYQTHLFSPTRDKNYQTMYKKIAKIEDLKSEKGLSEARRLIHVDLASRVLFLALWIQKYGNNSESMRKHLLCQLNGGQTVVKRIATSLGNENLTTLEQIFQDGITNVM
ncbi:hypothetical protein HK096_004658, partial [Nowakowskiella sp. JEL0078]